MHTVFTLLFLLNNTRCSKNIINIFMITCVINILNNIRCSIISVVPHQYLKEPIGPADENLACVQTRPLTNHPAASPQLRFVALEVRQLS